MNRFGFDSYALYRGPSGSSESSSSRSCTSIFYAYVIRVLYLNLETVTFAGIGHKTIISSNSGACRKSGGDPIVGPGCPIRRPLWLLAWRLIARGAGSGFCLEQNAIPTTPSTDVLMSARSTLSVIFVASPHAIRTTFGVLSLCSSCCVYSYENKWLAGAVFS